MTRIMQVSFAYRRPTFCTYVLHMSGLQEILTFWTTQARVSDAERNPQHMLHKSCSEKRLTPHSKCFFLLFSFSFFLPFRKETYNSFHIGFYHRKDLCFYVPHKFLLEGETPILHKFQFYRETPNVFRDTALFYGLGKNPPSCITQNTLVQRTYN